VYLSYKCIFAMLACFRLLPTATELGGMGRLFESVCLFVWTITQKTKEPKVFKRRMTLGYPRNGVVLGLKGQGRI